MHSFCNILINILIPSLIVDIAAHQKKKKTHTKAKYSAGYIRGTLKWSIWQTTKDPPQNYVLYFDGWTQRWVYQQKQAKYVPPPNPLSLTLRFQGSISFSQVNKKIDARTGSYKETSVKEMRCKSFSHDFLSFTVTEQVRKWHLIAFFSHRKLHSINDYNITQQNYSVSTKRLADFCSSNFSFKKSLENIDAKYSYSHRLWDTYRFHMHINMLSGVCLAKGVWKVLLP